MIKKIEELQKFLKIDGVRLVHPENIHITLLFLGNLREDEVDVVKKKLDSVSFNYFKVYISDVGFFPDKKNMKIIWVGVDSNELISLAKIIYDKFNIKSDFVPHITIARIKKTSSEKKQILLKILDNFHNKNFGNFVVKEIKLMKSILEKNGPIYSELYSKKLKENEIL